MFALSGRRGLSYVVRRAKTDGGRELHRRTGNIRTYSEINKTDQVPASFSTSDGCGLRHSRRDAARTCTWRARRNRLGVSRHPFGHWTAAWVPAGELEMASGYRGGPGRAGARWRTPCALKRKRCTIWRSRANTATASANQGLLVHNASPGPCEPGNPPTETITQGIRRRPNLSPGTFRRQMPLGCLGPFQPFTSGTVTGTCKNAMHGGKYWPGQIYRCIVMPQRNHPRTGNPIEVHVTCCECCVGNCVNMECVNAHWGSSPRPGQPAASPEPYPGCNP